jgi:hypothetical protein
MQLFPYIKHDTRSDGPYHLHRAECRDDPGALTSWNPKSHIRLVAENLLPFYPLRRYMGKTLTTTQRHYVLISSEHPVAHDPFEGGPWSLY